MFRAMTFAAAMSALALLMFAVQAAAQDARIDRVEVLEFGFYTSDKTGTSTTAPGAAAGRTDTITNVRFLKAPSKVAAGSGVGIGIRFESVGRSRGEETTIRSVWKIPAPGVTNPRSGNTYRQSVVEFKTRVGDVHMRGYTFDEEWEVVRGVWTLEIWQDDRMLAAHNFTVE